MPYLNLRFLPRRYLIISFPNTLGNQSPQLPALELLHLLGWANSDVLLWTGDVSEDLTRLGVLRLYVPLPFDCMFDRERSGRRNRRFDRMNLPRKVSLALILELLCTANVRQGKIQERRKYSLLSSIRWNSGCSSYPTARCTEIRTTTRRSSTWAK